MAADERFCATRRVLLTSTGDRGDLIDGEVDCHLTKPVRPSVLWDCMTHALGEATVAGAAADFVQSAPTAALYSQPVLVAEDNPVSQEVARRMLECLGCQVDVVGTGVQVVSAVGANSYGLIFMDCQMPEMDGYEATAVLRDQERPSQHTPVIALTASAMEGDAERCFAAGMDDYLTKPVRIDDFKAVLGRWMPAASDGEGVTDPVVDLTVMPELSSHSPQAAELATLFVTTVAPQIASLREAAQAHEIETVCRLSHAVKGAALYLGAKGLAAKCQALEGARDTTPSRIEEQVGAVEEEFRRVQDFLDSQASR